MSRNIFTSRESYLEFEYPEVQEYIDMMNTSFWVHKEVDFTSDVQDYRVNLTELERTAVRRALLSIAQVEVAVKKFWGNLYQMFPKPEFNDLGSTHAESETRHSQAYARLVEVLGLSNDFKSLLEVPIFKKRYNMMNQYLETAEVNQNIAKLLFFTLVVENASLFSQFATVLYFSKFRGSMKNVSNIISWTSVDEQVHALTGIFLLNTLVSEGHVNISELQKEVDSFLPEYMEMESKLLDWIFERGELEHMSKSDLLNYMKWRLNDSLTKMGLKPVFPSYDSDPTMLDWFEDIVFAKSLDDFFAKRPTAYTKSNEAITGDSIF